MRPVAAITPLLVCSCATRGPRVELPKDAIQKLHAGTIMVSAAWLTGLYLCDKPESVLLQTPGSTYELGVNISLDALSEQRTSQYKLFGYVDPADPQAVDRESVHLLPHAPSFAEYLAELLRQHRDALAGNPLEEPAREGLIVYLCPQAHASGKLARLALVAEVSATGQCRVRCESVSLVGHGDVVSLPSEDEGDCERLLRKRRGAVQTSRKRESEE